MYCCAPDGIQTIENDHPDVKIFCAVDGKLNENAYIFRVLVMLETEYMELNNEVLLL
ncbi:hypothetical protein [Methanobrevibacter sp.]|uniref:hypothetical protein n=1 Tax=Methanobrevibacter sp. TaxID=66852 RepID=UPI00386A0F4A